jgi:hypothetical protein
MTEQEPIEIQPEPTAEQKLREALRAVSAALVDLANQINKAAQQ